MNKDDILKRLKIDKDYYGDFGKQYLSNSNVSTLLKNPLALHEPSGPRPAFLVGGYFHTAILEPNKLKILRLLSLLQGILKRIKRSQVENYAYYSTK